MLWNMLSFLEHEVERKYREFEIKVSHDVDVPFKYYFKSPIVLIKSTARELIKEKNVVNAGKQPFLYIGSKINPEKYDPFFTFNLIMDISDKNGLKSAFYFLSDNTAGKIDGDYDIFHPRIQSLLKHIDNRGHEIGLHGSYNSYNNKDQYAKEWCKLNDSCNQVNVKQIPFGSRQHFLRWDTPKSLNIIESSKVYYDTTLAYADHIGFRTGTCYEYPAFDISNRTKLNLIIRPLLLMECSLLDKRYMNQNKSQAVETGINLKDLVKKYQGIFSLLWHNTRVVDENEICLYKNLLSS